MYRLGLDIGIGSIGWAVISGDSKARHKIEDFGVRIFESGEMNQGKDTLCRDRRASRGTRRLERRKIYRRILLRNHFEYIGMINKNFEDDLVNISDDDVYALKVKGLDEELTPAELFKCLIHTSNHRGYRDFYADTDDFFNDEDESDDEEEGKNKKAVGEFSALFAESGKRTVSEFLMSDFSEGKFVKYRNRKTGTQYYLISRDLLKDELTKILNAQSRYYKQLTPDTIDSTLGIVFTQRDFEDGPGDKNDNARRYHGFLETLGKCEFYKDEDRGFRSTLISDIYSAVNVLSQFRYVNTETGEYCLPRNAAEDIIDEIVKTGTLTKTMLTNVLSRYSIKVLISKNIDTKIFGKSVKFIKDAKRVIESNGLSWESITAEEQFDVQRPSMIHRIGELLSKYQTPKRRITEFKKAGIPDEMIKAFSKLKTSGTAMVSYKYMLDAIAAFKNGDIYGNFQADFLKNAAEESPCEKHFKLAPECIDDEDVKNNRVVFRSINETRKIINAIIDCYGSPSEIVVEVASELGKGFLDRKEEADRQRENEKKNDTVKKKIVEIMQKTDKTFGESDITGMQIDKYNLYLQQNGKSLYSGKPLGDIEDVINDKRHKYEVDHIVPYSLILDNTLQNKALVYTEENQKKGQRTPLMYLEDSEKDAYVARVKELYTREKNSISRKKYEYLMLGTLYGEEARQMLDAWKSRNINDTRYITKYIVGILKKNLKFAESDYRKSEHVLAVKGAVTAKFRKAWFRDTVWGSSEKDRTTYLNHALDAVVMANLTRPYIEIGSDAMRLNALLKKHKGKVSDEYNEYLDKCLSKMENYYGFGKEYTRSLLTGRKGVPSFVPYLKDEVAVRFNDGLSKESFDKNVKKYYGSDVEDFVVNPHIPVTSHKQETKFRGTICDANPLKIVKIDGNDYKISKKIVTDITKKDIEKLYTCDDNLISTLNRIFEGKDEKYKVSDYMKENDITTFCTDIGQPVNKVSLKSAFSNYYPVDKGNGNRENLGMLKYYCLEVYKDSKGKTGLCGIRFVDLVKKGKQLYRKPNSFPNDYASHVMYVFQHDYLKVSEYSKKTGKNEVKFEGFYQNVHTLSRHTLRGSDSVNSSVTKDFIISAKSIVQKFDVHILGRLGGEIHCSEQFPLLPEKD